MGLRVLGTVVVAAPCWIGCGSEAPTASPAASASASATASTAVAPPIAPVEAPDLAAIRELVRAGRVRAENELAELLAPPANARPAGPEQLAAVGPCVAPTPEEKAKLGKRVRTWALAEKNPWIEVTAKDAKVAPLEWGCVEPAGVVVRVAVEWAPRCANHHAVLRVGEEKIEALAESWTPELSCERVFYDQAKVVALVDVDADGTRDLLAMYDHHGQIWSQQWMFVPGKTPDPRLEIGGDYGHTDVPARVVKSDEGLIAYWPPPSYLADQPGLHGFFVEVLKSGVVTDRSPRAQSFTKRLDAIHTAIEAEKQLSLGGEVNGAARLKLRQLLRDARVADSDVARVLGGETREETIARVRDEATATAKNATAILDGEVADEPCEPLVPAYDAPFQIPTWGACAVPDAAARARVEPAIQAWLEKESGPLIARSHPDPKDRTSTVVRGEVVASYGCEREGAFFVTLDGGRPERVSALFRWDGQALTQLAAASGSRCVQACLDGEERRLNVALADLDADGDVEAIVRLQQGCDASPTKQNLDDRCTKTEIFWAGQAPRPLPGGGLSREDAKGSRVCRVAGAIHVLEDARDPVTPIKPVVAVIGATGLTAPGATSPYAERIAHLKARVEAAQLVRRPDGASPERLRDALKLLDVSERDAAVFLATP